MNIVSERTIFHEIGHILIAAKLGAFISHVEIPIGGGAGGSASPLFDPPDPKSELLMLVGGLQCDRIFFGPRFTTKQSSDYDKAFVIARAMAQEDSLKDGDFVGVRTGEILIGAEKAARDILKEHRPAVQALALLFSDESQGEIRDDEYGGQVRSYLGKLIIPILRVNGVEVSDDQIVPLNRLEKPNDEK